MSGRVLLFLILALLARTSFASDGVLKINQACATSSTGCFPGDTAGFPVTIGQTGSYRLTGNLSVPLNVTAIQTNAVNVTLDLGGFIVNGANVCAGYPTTGCSVTNGNPGISSAQYLVVVRNGSVSAMGGDCISLTGRSSEVDRVRALSCGRNGILVGGTGRITRSFAGANVTVGIGLDAGGYAEGHEARANGGIGIYLSTLLSITQGGELIGNRAFDNGSQGIFAQIGGDGVLVSRNVISRNAVLGIGDVPSSLGDNLCNGTRC